MQTGLGNNRQSRAAGSSSMLTALIRNQAIAQNQLTTKANKNTAYSFITPTVFGREQSSSTNQAFSFLTSNFAGGSSGMSPSNTPSNVFVVDFLDAMPAVNQYTIDYVSLSPPVYLAGTVLFQFSNVSENGGTPYNSLAIITSISATSPPTATTTTGTPLNVITQGGPTYTIGVQKSPSGTLTRADIEGMTLTAPYAAGSNQLLFIVANYI